MARKSKRTAGRTDGENEGEEVVAQTARSNVGRKHGRQMRIMSGVVGRGNGPPILPGVVERGNGPPILPLVMKEGGIQNVRRKSGTSNGPPPRNRASPSRLFVLNSGLEDIQKDGIGDISFGGALDIGTRTMKGDLVKFVMKCYDPELSQLVIPDRGKIPVDGASIERIWGLPRGHKKVAYELDPNIVRLFNEMFIIPTGPTPTVTKWCEMIKELGVVADDKFLSVWLVVVFSCFLAPTTSLKVSPRAYSAALNPREILNSNVC